MADTSTPSPHYMLTTVDNPYHPHHQFDEWLVWDETHGYCSSGMLARIAKLSDELSEADQATEIQRAIDEIVQENVLGVCKKISASDSISH
jgi:hypothetical protein